MSVKLIVARGANGAIGKDNDLIWKLPRDMRFFTETTTGGIVIMGRKNWDSIPLKYRPLTNRVNVVVTRNEDFESDDCVVCPSIEDAIGYFSHDTEKDIFIIGGGQIYKYCLDNDLVDEMYITEVRQEFDADVYFPDFDEGQWQKELLMEYKADEKHKYDFDIYRFTRN